jgi:hypothetical protein
MGKTLLHEYTHYLFRTCNGWADEPTFTMEGNGKSITYDLGFRFELEAYGDDGLGYGHDEWSYGCRSDA